MDSVLILDVLLWALLWIYFPFLYIFYRNRLVHPIKGRMPWAVIIVDLDLFLYTTIFTGFGIWGIPSCNLSYVIDISLTFTWMYLYLYRLICLLFSFEITKNLQDFTKGIHLSEWQESWYTKNRKYIRITFMRNLYIFLILAIWIWNAVVLSILPDPPLTSNGTCDIGSTSEQLKQAVYLGMAAFFIISYILVGCKLSRHHADAFQIKKEFTYTLYLCSTAFILYLIIVFLNGSFNLVILSMVLIFHGGFLASIVFPVILSQRELVQLNRKTTSFTNLLELLHNPHGSDTFLLYLEKEFSTENLFFWRDIEQWKKIDIQVTPMESLIATAEELCHKYLRNDSPCLVNLPAGVREDIFCALEQPVTAVELVPLFNKAQEEIYNLMASDSYPRFQRTPEFENLTIVRDSKSKGDTNSKALSELDITGQLVDGGLEMDNFKLAIRMDSSELDLKESHLLLTKETPTVSQERRTEFLFPRSSPSPSSLQPHSPTTPGGTNFSFVSPTPSAENLVQSPSVEELVLSSPPNNSEIYVA